jgi:hypothetical protein
MPELSRFYGIVIKMYFDDHQEGGYMGRYPGLTPGATVLPPLTGLRQESDFFISRQSRNQTGFLHQPFGGLQRRGAPTDSSPGWSRRRNPG